MIQVPVWQPYDIDFSVMMTFISWSSDFSILFTGTDKAWVR